MQYKCHIPINFGTDIVNKELDNNECEILINGTCHVDHEGFDLNEIEQFYYHKSGIAITRDSTWYKDGGQGNGTTAMLQPWFEQITKQDDKLIIDHSHFVFKYPIAGAAREQVFGYIHKRPELLRVVSTNFKCGLDLCIDYLDVNEKVVEPIVHIEWDFDNFSEMETTAEEVKDIIDSKEWMKSIDAILRYNKLAKKNKVDAFDQADTRAMIMFGSKAYKLIPTL